MSKQTILIHGAPWDLVDVQQTASHYVEYEWTKRTWVPHNWVLCVNRDDGAINDVFVVLAEEADTDAVQHRVEELSARGWRLSKPPSYFADSHDHCPICSWALCVCHGPEHAEGYWNDDACEWLCVGCYESVVRPLQQHG